MARTTKDLLKAHQGHKRKEQTEDRNQDPSTHLLEGVEEEVTKDKVHTDEHDKEVQTTAYHCSRCSRLQMKI